MSVRQVRVRGKKRWQARVAYRGGRLSRLCDSKDEAKQAEADFLKELVAKAEQDTQAEAAPATLELLCEAYLLDLEARGKAPESILRAKDTKRRLTEFFGARMQEPLGKFTEADLYAFRSHRMKGNVKPSTIDRDFITIRAMLRKVSLDFRFPHGLLSSQDNTRVRWLEPIQEVDVMSRLREPFRAMARLAGLTLMRLSEIRRLRREQVALSQGVILLPKAKTGPGTVVLNSEARRILQEQLDSHSSEWVFPSRLGGPYSRDHVGRVWRRAAKAAGLHDFHFHDLRHHGATIALNAGYSSSIVMALGRWKSEKMMHRYAAVTDRTLRAAAEAVSGNCGNAPWQRQANPAVFQKALTPFSS